MNKMCGNCSGDHRFKDCPYITSQLTKDQYKILSDKAENWERLSNYGWDNTTFDSLVKHQGRVMDKKTHDYVEMSSKYHKADNIVEKIKKVIDDGLAEDGFDSLPEDMCIEIQKILEGKE